MITDGLLEVDIVESGLCRSFRVLFVTLGPHFLRSSVERRVLFSPRVFDVWEGLWSPGE